MRTYTDVFAERLKGELEKKAGTHVDHARAAKGDPVLAAAHATVALALTEVCEAIDKLISKGGDAL